MKKNKLAEAKLKDAKELKKEISVVSQQLAKLRLEIVSGKTKNLRAAKSLRKDMAQLQTIINNKGESNE